MRDKERPLWKVAANQHGVVSHRQLLRLGYSKSTISREVTRGRLHRLHRGVYAVGHPGLTNHGRCLGAVLACGRGAMLSHASAAWLWGLRTRCPGRPEVTVPARGHRGSKIVIHHSTVLEPEDRSIRDRVPVTAVARTALDLAARVTKGELESLLERAEKRGLLALAEIDSLLSRCGGHTGAAPLRDALGIYRDPAFIRSLAERRLLALVKAAALPRPAMNTWVGEIEVDAYWERERFAVEIDSYEHHGTRAAFERDPLRHENLKLIGIDSIRFTARRIEREPRQVAARLKTLLDRRREELRNRT
jgi:very-short-patch-repair endonuclease